MLEYLAGETLYGLSKRHDVSRNVIRLWIARYEAGGAPNDETTAGDLLQDLVSCAGTNHSVDSVEIVQRYS